MENVFNWLHLSDLHFRAGDQYDQRVVLSSLLADLTCLVNNGQEIDTVFVTGDIAFSGSAPEYYVASKFFRDLSSATGVSMNRIFCVPGNHDVDRSRIHQSVVPLDTREAVSDVIGNRESRIRFTNRLDAYYTFLRETFSWASSITISDLSFTQTVTIRGIRVAVVGLNSAWAAGETDDYGRAVIGERQVREALDKTTDSDCVIALFHHPLNWTAEFDSRDVRGLLDRRCDFLLHGHVHEFGVVNVQSPDSWTFDLAAGATYQGRRESLSYNLVSLDLGNSAATVVLRSYSDRNGGFWAPDGTMYRSAPDGVLSLKLPEHVTRQPQLVDLRNLNERLSALISEGAPTRKSTQPLPSVPRPPMALVKEVREGKCILFAGAGASMDAKMPGWIELLRGMIDRAEEAGVVKIFEKHELERLLGSGGQMVVAAFCRERLGAFEFAEFLNERLSDANVASKTHRILAEIPFRGAITTNFDSLLEHSRPRAQVVLPEMMERLGSAGVESLLRDGSTFPVVKMHGTAEDVDSIVLTRSDFRKVLFEKPKYREFLRRLFTDFTIFFHGYSFRDPNVDFALQDLTSSYGGKSRPHYALLPDPGSVATKYWFEDFNLRVIPYELWEGSHVVATAFLQAFAAAST